jgi:hypothetical protein
VLGNALVAVRVTTANGFFSGEPQRFFEVAPGAFEGRGQRYTVTPEGQKLIIVEGAEGDQSTVSAIQFTPKWFAGSNTASRTKLPKRTTYLSSADKCWEIAFAPTNDESRVDIRGKS